jgi:carbonic anhydrase/acetyltransferase-like protein (isoleucine patch superfamily)
MLIEYDGHRPRVGRGVFVAPTAVLIGRVTVEAGASIWYGAVIRADHGRVHVGKGSSIQDNAVVHAHHEQDTIVGDGVTVGHGAVLEGCRVERGAVVGIRATVLPGAVIGKEALVAAGSVVPERMQVPARHVVAGVPARVKKPLSKSALRWVEMAAPAYERLSAGYLRQGLGIPLGREEPAPRRPRAGAQRIRRGGP